MIGNNNERTHFEWVKKTLLSIPRGLRILDAGAGQMQFKQFCRHLNYVAQDFAQYNGEGDGVGRQNGKWEYPELDIVCDILNIPEPDKSFDVILFSNTLEHVPDAIGTLKELDRLLRVGGTMIVTAPFCCLTHQSPYFFYTGFSNNFYNTWLPNYKLNIEYNGNYYEWLAQELHRINVRENFIYDLLEEKSKEDPFSYQVLCFGLMITAIKNE